MRWYDWIFCILGFFIGNWLYRAGWTVGTFQFWLILGFWVVATSDISNKIKEYEDSKKIGGREEK